MYSKKIILILMLLGWIYPLAGANAAEDKITLTISPPLIRINMSPGQSWSSSIKLVNNNSAGLKISVKAYDFKDKGDGAVQFIPRSSETDRENSQFSLSQWISVSEEPLDIPAQSVVEIPYTINLPSDVEPGGHYGAIQVSTLSQDKIEGSGVSVSSSLTSLILLKVKGEIRESGRIIRFNTGKRIYQKPEAEFSVNFENSGNIHLLPQGEIKIYGMFEREVGAVLINQSSDSGHVLPGTARNWSFVWTGSESIWKMGRYKAVLTLSYGDEKRTTDNRVIYFWVLNFKVIAIVAGAIVLVALALVALIKFYIKRAIINARKEMELYAPQAVPAEIPLQQQKKSVRENVKRTAKKRDQGKPGNTGKSIAKADGKKSSKKI